MQDRDKGAADALQPPDVPAPLSALLDGYYISPSPVPLPGFSTTQAVVTGEVFRQQASSSEEQAVAYTPRR